ncbi:MAG: STAS/SEC14 domain-containing protein [Methylococcales bacterium]|nr:STAS/SEC14 domain-containing protein [Methylococcales bacterium]
MSFELIKKMDQEIWLKISGQFSVEDYEKTQLLILSELELYHESRGLIILDNFTGWSKDQRWDEILFMQEHADQITKIAIVGDEKWKEEFYMFLGKSFRSTGIEFFPENQLEQATLWLSAVE